MKLNTRKPFLAVAALLVTALAGVGVASAEFGDSPVLPSDPLVSPSRVPVDQTQAFGALRQPATPVAAVAPAVKAQIATGSDVVRAFGVDLANVRELSGIAGRQRFYVAPARKGICLFLDDGASACTEHVDGAAKYGLALAVVPPGVGRASADMNPIGKGEIVTYGIIGDGVTAVVGRTVSGKHIDAQVDGNAYVLVTNEPLAETQFQGVGSSWSSSDAPRLLK